MLIILRHFLKIINGCRCCISHYILICHAYLMLCPCVALFLESYRLPLTCKLVVWLPCMTLEVILSLIYNYHDYSYLAHHPATIQHVSQNHYWSVVRSCYIKYHLSCAETCSGFLFTAGELYNSFCGASVLKQYARCCHGCKSTEHGWVFSSLSKTSSWPKTPASFTTTKLEYLPLDKFSYNLWIVAIIPLTLALAVTLTMT